MGITPSGYDGTQVITAATATTFSYTLPTNTNPGTATITTGASAFPANALPSQAGVGNFINTTGPTDNNPFVEGIGATPRIAGIANGAESYGILGDQTLINVLETSGYLPNLLSTVTTDNTPPSGAVVAVLREPIPAGFDQYAGYDLVLYVNLTNVALGGPQMGVTEGSTDTSFNPALQYSGLSIPTTIGALPGHGIFATLIPSTDPGGGQYVNASLSGPFNNLSGQALSEDNALYITAQFGNQSAGLPLTGLQSITTSSDGNSVYALSVTNNVLVVANHDLSLRQEIAVNGLNADSQVVLSPDGRFVYVTEPLSNSVAVFRTNGTNPLTTPQPSVSLSNSQTAGAMVINPNAPQAFLGGPGGLMSYSLNSDGSLTAKSDSYQLPTNGGTITELALSNDSGHPQFLYAIDPQTSTLMVFNLSKPNPLSSGPVASFSGSVNGLEDISAIAVSPDDQYIYATSADGATLAVFQRNLHPQPNTNPFSWLQTLEQSVNGVKGLVDADGVVVSTRPANQYVYVTGGTGNSLAVFERQPNNNNMLLPVQLLHGTQSLSDPGGIAEDRNGVVYGHVAVGLGRQRRWHRNLRPGAARLAAAAAHLRRGVR